jgi:hypothetical protein
MTFWISEETNNKNGNTNQNDRYNRQAEKSGNNREDQ